VSSINPRQTIRGHTERVGRVAHLPCGQRIITHSTDGSLRIWNIKSGVQIGGEWRDDGDEAEVRTAASSPNGESIAVGSSDGILRVWDVGTGNVIAKWIGYMDHVGSVCWGADGEHVASGCEDGMVVYSPNTTTIATGGGNDESGVLRQASCSSSSTQSKTKFPISEEISRSFQLGMDLGSKEAYLRSVQWLNYYIRHRHMASESHPQECPTSTLRSGFHL
jgi:WD40 repeat protein